MSKQASVEETPEPVKATNIQDVFSKVALRLGVEVSEPESIDFGDSFVKYAEDNDSSPAHETAHAMRELYDAIKVGRILAIDENLRNLFNDTEDDEELASSISIRTLLEEIQGPEQ